MDILASHIINHVNICYITDSVSYFIMYDPHVVQNGHMTNGRQTQR